MKPTFAVAIYLFIWWIVLFAVLPFHTRTTQGEEGDVVPGTPESAPAKVNVWKIIWTNTIVATVVFALVYMAIVNKWITGDLITLS
jgi:predicted secreted protein